MKLGYGTYGMKQLDIFEVLPRLKEIGYEAVEITVASGWMTDPERLDSNSRKRLVDQLQALAFPVPVLLDLMHPCVQGEQRAAMLQRFAAVCRLAQDLNYGSEPGIVTGTLGNHTFDWESGKENIAACLLEVAAIATEYNTIFAVEAHVGGALDSPEKAAWLMEATRHTNLKLNFDISHFAIQGMDVQRCVELCAPYAVHCHVKDGILENGRVRFMLPGEGEFDYPAFFALLQQTNLKLPVVVEVSGMVWNQPDYDPWKAAVSCYSVLSHAASSGTHRAIKF